MDITWPWARRCSYRPWVPRIAVNGSQNKIVNLRHYEICLQLSWTVLEPEPHGWQPCVAMSESCKPDFGHSHTHWAHGGGLGVLFILHPFGTGPWLSKNWVPVFWGSCPITLGRKEEWKAAQTFCFGCQINSDPIELLFSILTIWTWAPKEQPAQCQHLISIQAFGWSVPFLWVVKFLMLGVTLEATYPYVQC